MANPVTQLWSSVFSRETSAEPVPAQQVQTVSASSDFLPNLPSPVRTFFGIENERRTVRAPTNNGVPTRGALAAIAPNATQQTAPTTPVVPAGPAPLRRGDQGPRVLELQNLLRDTGFLYEEPDGVFGRSTERAVIDFQAAYIGSDGEQLGLDGVAGETTIDALKLRKAAIDQRRARPDTTQPEEMSRVVPDFAGLGEVQVLRLNARGTEVTRAQTLLRTLGYEVALNDIYDETTQAAIADFQRRYTLISGTALDQDAVLGPSTGYAMARSAQLMRESPMTWLDYARQVETTMQQQASVPTAPAPQEPPLYVPTVAANRTGMPPLKAGSNDRAAVIALQTQLRELDYDIAVDGDFGNGTTAALADFQRLYALFTGEVLIADGVLGDTTRAALTTAARNGLMQRLPQAMRVGKVETGYERGSPRTIVVRNVGDGGGRLETRAALAYYAMRAAALEAGSTFNAGSSFRTMADQRHLRRVYRNYPGRAARPGYSTHQTGIAIDTENVNTTGARWLRENARKYGFVLPGYVYGTPSGGTAVEDWHWEYRVDRLPNQARAFYGLPVLSEDPQATTPQSQRSGAARRAKR